MADFDIKTAVETAANEIIQSEDFADIIRTNIKNAVENSIKASFNYGALSKAISKKVEEYLVPYIEQYDMSDFAPKLDDVLTEIIKETPIKDIQKTLSNFKTLMTVPDTKVIDLKDLFGAYCKYMAKAVNTYGRDVTFDSGEPEYESFECRVDYEDISSSYSIFEKLSLDFTVEEGIETECDEPANFNIVLHRYKDDNSKDYDIEFDREFNINGLRNLSDFELLLINYSRAGVKVRRNSIDDLSDFVTPENEPEASYS